MSAAPLDQFLPSPLLHLHATALRTPEVPVESLLICFLQRERWIRDLPGKREEAGQQGRRPHRDAGTREHNQLTCRSGALEFVRQD